MAAGLAQAMTAAMRNHPHENEHHTMTQEGLIVDEEGDAERRNLTRSIGSSFTVDTCVRVQWPYNITYRATLLALQVFFNLLVFFSRSRNEEGGYDEYAGWKSSPLALLFHDFDDSLRSKTGGVSTVRDMDVVARQTRVRLISRDCQVQSGWKFHEE